MQKKVIRKNGVSLFSLSKSKSERARANSIESIVEDADELYNQIISASNPQKFIEPYNPHKLAIANDIYAKAINNKGNVKLLKNLWKRIEIEL